MDRQNTGFMKIALLTNEFHVKDIQRVLDRHADAFDFLYVFEKLSEDKKCSEEYYLFQKGKDSTYEFLWENRVDFVLVYGWDYMIPSRIVESFPCFNIHPSLLPKYRGPDPVTVQLLEKERLTGVTIHKMNDRLDAGPIWKQKEIKIDPTQPRLVYLKIAGTVMRLVDELLSTLEKAGFDASKLGLFPQNEEEATYYSRKRN